MRNRWALKFIALIILGLTASGCSLTSQRLAQLQVEAATIAAQPPPAPVVIDARTNIDEEAAPPLMGDFTVPQAAQPAGIGGGSYQASHPIYHIPVSCRPRHDWGLYHVRFGDTLTRLAVRFRTTVYQLAVGNCISNPDRIFAGQLLRVPAYHPPPVHPPPPRIRHEGRVLPHPFIATNGYSFAVQGGTVITLRWEHVNLHGLHRVEFYYTPPHSPAIRLGIDAFLADGASISWAVPVNAYGILTAAGFDGSGRVVVRTAYETFVYAQAVAPTVPAPATPTATVIPFDDTGITGGLPPVIANPPTVEPTPIPFMD